MVETTGLLPLLGVVHHTTPIYMHLLSFTSFLRA